MMSAWAEWSGAGQAELWDGLERGIGGILGIAGREFLLIVAGRAVIARQLRVVVVFEGVGELAKVFDELGGRLVGEIDR